MTSRTLNASEAAQLLRIHPQTLMTRARTGVIPGCKVGRAWVFVESLLIDSSVRLKVEQIQLVSDGCLNGLGSVGLQGA